MNERILRRPKADREQITIPPDGQPVEKQPRWRQDFPIDWPQDHYVSRRDFTKFMMLTSLAFTVGQFWIVVENFRRRRRGQLPLRQIAILEHVPVGGFMTFAYPESTDHCLLVRPSADTVVAYSQKCTHLSCSVVPRPEEGSFHCPCHEGFFDLQTGRPLAGPPRRPLPRIMLEVRQGAVYASGVEVTTL